MAGTRRGGNFQFELQPDILQKCGNTIEKLSGFRLGEKKKEKKYFAAYKLLDWNLDAVGATEVYG
jgi:hypothetical protein